MVEKIRDVDVSGEDHKPYIGAPPNPSTKQISGFISKKISSSATVPKIPTLSFPSFQFKYIPSIPPQNPSAANPLGNL